MDMTAMAREYLNSATAIKGRVDELKAMQKSKKFKEQKKIEDRIVLLNAEYYYLIHVSAFLKNYYNDTRYVKQSEVKWD